MSAPSTVYRTEFPGLDLVARGKVRDVYDLGERLLFVATDRLSAFDVVFPTPIPGKGMVLNQISAFWFERFRDRVQNHVVTTEISRFPATLRPHAAVLSGRSMLVKKLRMIPIECVARGYLAGSGWKEYQESGTVCGIRVPAGLREADALPEPIFTPATKSDTGHDINITFAEVEKRVGPETAASLRIRTLEIYALAASYAREKGIIIADTKFEFGFEGDRLTLADELLTPDSSRFWPVDRYAPGGSPPSLDKQFVRNWLERTGWDKSPPAPELPPDIVAGARDRYLELFRILTGRDVTP